MASVGDEFDRNGPSDNGLIYWSKDIIDDEAHRDAMAGASGRAPASSTRQFGRGAVVVHCAAGISRSACVVLGYMVVHGGKSLRDALRHTIERRPCIWPNEGFMAALVDLRRRCEARSR